MIDNYVAPVASSYGVPEYVWKSIMLMESGGNPKAKAVTEKEASYGLFQLNTKGGQGTSYKSNPELLFDPGLNAQIAMPPIAKAYKAGRKIYDDGPELAGYVAARSGHPGYNVPLDDYRIKKVVANAEKLLGINDFNKDPEVRGLPDELGGNNSQPNLTPELRGLSYESQGLISGLSVKGNLQNWLAENITMVIVVFLGLLLIYTGLKTAFVG